MNGAIRTLEDVASVLAECSVICEVLREVASLALPDGCVAAGMVRNAVWDALHDREPTLHPRSDVDVIFFDPARRERLVEQAAENRLHASRPDVPWQVRNQARMQLQNGDPPYRGASDATRFYPETATAISARWSDGRVLVEAPLGIDDLLALVVRATPHFARKPAQYRARLATKDWASRWPRLRFMFPDDV